MNEAIFERIDALFDDLKLNMDIGEFAKLAEDLNMTAHELNQFVAILDRLRAKKNEAIIATCLKLSRLPIKEPKTFSDFDFTRIRGPEVEKIKNLETLAPLYERKNIAFIGKQGIGKTHLAIAFGEKCCQNGIKTYFLKASELNQRFTQARNSGRIGSVMNGLVKPSCLIIDEIGRCVFDKTNTQLFFDMVDRRYHKEGPNCMIFTSNKSANTWRDYFEEPDSLLCALDRIFDRAIIFMMDGEGYRGKHVETISIHTGE